MEQTHRKVRLSSYGRLGVMLACIGVILAVDTMADISFLYKLWPVLTAILGIGFIGIYTQRARREAVYIGVGAYIIGFSGLALYCSMTTWGILADLWPLFIAFMGISFTLGYFLGKRNPILLLVGLLFISLSLVFFFVFSLNHKLWWSVFILAGISFLIFDRVRRS